MVRTGTGAAGGGRSHYKSHQVCKGTVESHVNLMSNMFQ